MLMSVRKLQLIAPYFLTHYADKTEHMHTGRIVIYNKKMPKQSDHNIRMHHKK